MNKKLRAAMFAGAVTSLSVTAFADNAPATSDGPLTYKGITLYGTIDVGIQYQSAGAPQSDYYANGTQEVVGKSSRGSQAVIGGNNLSSSKVGLKGKEDIGNGWSGVFLVETGFNPWSGQISDGLRSLAANNGKATGVQSTSGDSSLAGQLFNNSAYLGVSHAQYGTLTFGRVLGLLADGIAKYDPMVAGYAVSPLTGTAPGGGDTENKRLDNSVKYDVTLGAVHAGAQYQAKSGANPGTTQEFVLGAVAGGGSIDAFYMQKNDAISAAALSAAQLTSVVADCTAATPATNTACVTDTSKTVAGTISDNTTYGVMGKYAFNDARTTVYGGYEQIKYQNPSNPVSAGIHILGGYILGAVNTQTGSSATFPNPRKLTISWVGAKYWATPKIELTGAIYRYDQNNYGNSSSKGWTAGCSTNASSTCSGSQNFVSFSADYHLSKRFDVYAAAMWNQVQGGLSSGFAYATSTIDPTLGFRYSF